LSSKVKNANAAVGKDRAQVQADVDASFRETVTQAITRIETKDVPKKPTMDDQNKTFCTRLVSMWMLSNAGLAVAIENINRVQTVNDAEELRTKQNLYFEFILYLTFGLATVRFGGVCFSRTNSRLAFIKNSI
jgi:chitin synthase